MTHPYQYLHPHLYPHQYQYLYPHLYQYQYLYQDLVRICSERSVSIHAHRGAESLSPVLLEWEERMDLPGVAPAQPTQEAFEFFFALT